MAVQAQFGGLAGCLPCGGGGLVAEEQVRALRDYGGALLSAAAAGNKAYQLYNCAAGVVSGAQSELTCNGGGVELPSRKRGREDEFQQYVTSSSAALLPIPGMQKATVAQHSLSTAAIANRMVDSGAASTSGRPGTAASSVADALVSELWQQGAEVDALVRAQCERLRARLGQARKRQCQALAGAARLLWQKDAELDAARRRAADLEERLRQAAAESQAWCGLARSNEAVASGLRAALDTLLRGGAPAAQPAEEGFGDSGPALAAAAADDDAQSRCFVEAEDAAAAATSASWRACRSCGAGEASVLLLPCRHLCLCKACEPRADACPVCLAAKNASIHVATS